MALAVMSNSSGRPVPPAPLASSMDRALMRLAELSGSEAVRNLDGNELLMERAWLSGALFSHGRSTNGTSRLLATADGTIAVTLARQDDWALLPAWLASSDPDLAAEIDQQLGQESASQSSADNALWQHLADKLRGKSTAPLIDQGRTLGLPVAATGTHRDERAPDFSQLFRSGPAVSGQPTQPPRVIDLSALWAGPLCSHLLHLCGADVIKVESSNRPDGARTGQQAFFDLLNQGKRSVALDLSSRQGLQALASLLETADVVIESSRPRALRQLGIVAEEITRKHPKLIWISLTGYGRAEPAANWVAFGDDAGVAAGLSDAMFDAVGSYQFAGDAIADPLTGTHAALAVWQAHASGRGGMIELPLTDVAAWCLQQEHATDHRTSSADQPSLNHRFRCWWAAVSRQPVPPHYEGREILAPAADLGADTEAVLHALQQSC